MPKTREQKKDIVKAFTDKVAKAKSMVFVNFRGLKVKDIESFRKQCREKGAEYAVAKKTLMKIAFKDSKMDIDPKLFIGDIGTIFGFEDEVIAAKVAVEFSKNHEALKPIGGVLENSFIDYAKIAELSKIPGKKELYAKLVGSIKSPINGFVNVLAGNLRGLVRVLRAIQEKKI